MIHYCMGGLEIYLNSVVVGSNGKAIPGLYAAGEVAGGVHGNNRLGGNSLLDCYLSSDVVKTVPFYVAVSTPVFRQDGLNHYYLQPPTHRVPPQQSS